MSPIYEFISDDGKEERRDIYMAFEDAIDIGASTWVDGRRWRRLASNPTLAVKHFREFVCHQQAPQPASQDPASSGIIADRWVPDPDDPSELRPVYTSEETVKRNAAASKDAGDTYLAWT